MSTGVRVNVTARLYAQVCKCCVLYIFKNYDINTHRLHVNDNASNSGDLSILFPPILYLLFLITWFLFYVNSREEWFLRGSLLPCYK